MPRRGERFGGHEGRCSRRVGEEGVLAVELVADPEVRDLDVSVVAEQQVRWLDVSVDYLLVVYCGERGENGGREGE